MATVRVELKFQNEESKQPWSKFDRKINHGRNPTQRPGEKDLNSKKAKFPPGLTSHRVSKNCGGPTQKVDKPCPTSRPNVIQPHSKKQSQYIKLVFELTYDEDTQMIYNLKPICVGILLLCASMTHVELRAQTSTKTGFQKTTSLVQPKMVKIVGSGGFQGLEPYQSGFLVSGTGHILTVWSYVLDSDAVSVTLDDGQRFEAKLVGYDPRIEIAVLKIEGTGMNNFILDEAIPGRPGARILAFSNLYGVATGNEPASVQHGIISTKTKLSARKGAFKSMYQGDVYILDAVTNNPGAAGGAITDRKGRLIGMIGKELRDSQTNSWLNFAIPIDQLTKSVNDIRSGKMVIQSDTTRRKPTEPMTPDLIGVVLVADVVSRTPPFVDRVIVGSKAAKAGIQTDDLLIEVNGRMTPSNKEVIEAMSYVDRDATLNLTIQRGKEFKSIEINLAR